MRRRLLPILLPLVLLAACSSGEVASFPIPDEDYSHLGLTRAEAATLLSLEQVDDHPLYTMHHYAGYGYEEYEGPSAAGAEQSIWACSLFAALNDPDARIFGRNFDWDYSPAVLLFSHPPDGHASVAMVDIAYLGFAGERSQNLTDRPISELEPLLDAPYIPFDGLNDAGLVIGMAAVAPGNMQHDPDKPTIGSLGIIRLLLDKTATVAEAIDLMSGYNIDFVGGPPVHYLMADAGGDTALVEYYQGDVHVLRSDRGWHLATNFLAAAVESPEGQCRRYDTMAAELEAADGMLDSERALALLRDVAQSSTQWSVVYDLTAGEVQVAMGAVHEHVLRFSLEMATASRG